MTQLFRVRSVLSGFPGGPGVATMYFLDINTAPDSIRSFWEGMFSMIPADVTIKVDGVGDVIEDTTGALVGQWIFPAPAVVQCTGAGNYAAPAGGLIRWETGVIKDGRRLRGKTFVVPMIAIQFQTDGSLAPTTLTDMLAAAQVLITGQNASFVIWHRPFKGTPATATKPARPSHLGSHSLVTGASIPDKVVVLRSRRD